MPIGVLFMTAPNIELLSRINQEYTEKNVYFLHKLNLDWEQRKPFRNIRILHNLVNSFETLHKLEPLLRGGADLTVTRVDLIETPFRKAVEDILIWCGIRYIPNYNDLNGEFDIGLDCAARFLTIPSIQFKKGVVELTQSGTVLYRKAATPYPIISVDDSYLKNLECMYGTGEAFVRAFIELTGKELQHKKFLVFGYGKIGQGIVKYLSSFTQDITLVEKSPQALELAEKRGFTVLSAENSASIASVASQSFAIVTATGIPGLLSRYLSPSDVSKAYIANMGAEDEIGNKFAGHPHVLNHRAPINFSLKHPTRMKYLDPIFYAHNLAAEILIRPEAKFSPGYHPFDSKLDRSIVDEWVKTYQEDVQDIWESC
jgi:adenosylhomocysteinase